jgi:hypothetical protein
MIGENLSLKRLGSHNQNCKKTCKESQKRLGIKTIDLYEFAKASSQVLMTDNEICFQGQTYQISEGVFHGNPQTYIKANRK